MGPDRSDVLYGSLRLLVERDLRPLAAGIFQNYDLARLESINRERDSHLKRFGKRVGDIDFPRGSVNTLLVLRALESKL
jgi:hypothetical protein